MLSTNGVIGWERWMIFLAWELQAVGAVRFHDDFGSKITL